MKKLQKLKTFEDACWVEGLDPNKVVPDFSMVPSQDRDAMSAVLKLFIVTRAANRIANDGIEWIPDWNERSWKYTPWFYLGGSSGFRFDDFGRWASDSAVGSRLCFISEEVGNYVTKQFIDLYKQFMVHEKTQ